MNDRARAAALLKEVQEILVRRLTERVLEAREELLDDAEGLSFSGEIDAIYDQIALRLNHVNVMLANLPATVEESHSAAAGNSVALDRKPRSHPGVFQADTSTPAPSLDVATLAETAELMPEVFELAPPVSFESFVRHVADGDLLAAARNLSTLFDVDEQTGLRAATIFQNQWAASADMPHKTLQLRRELQAGANNAALGLLGECFGLRGLPGIAVLQTLRARMRFAE